LRWWKKELGSILPAEVLIVPVVAWEGGVRRGNIGGPALPTLREEVIGLKPYLNSWKKRRGVEFRAVHLDRKVV